MAKGSAGSLSRELKVKVVRVGETTVDNAVRDAIDTIHQSAGRVSVDQPICGGGSSLEQRSLIHVRPDQGIPESSHADAGTRAGSKTFILVRTSEERLVEPSLAQKGGRGGRVVGGRVEANNQTCRPFLKTRGGL